MINRDLHSVTSLRQLHIHVYRLSEARSIIPGSVRDAGRDIRVIGIYVYTYVIDGNPMMVM